MFIVKSRLLKLLSVFIAVIMFLPVQATVAAAESTPTDAPHILGDVNGDAKVNLTDAKLILKHIVKLNLLTGDMLKVADNNNDNKINLTDAKRVLKIIVHLSPDAPDPEPEPVQQKVNLLTPYSDHGLGKKDMCEVTADFAETVPSSTDNDKNDPNYSPEIKGSFDYIERKISKGGNYDQDYYVLSSGTKVATKNVKKFSGFVMPKNKVSAYDATTANSVTDLTITVDWKVPFISRVGGQNFYTGYENRPFNVSSFTGAYIDFIFYYTSSASGSFEIKNSSVIKSTQWMTNSNNGTSTLRVFFKTSGKYYGYKAYYSEYNRLVLSFNEKPTLSNAVVMLDAGHGGNDPGAIGTNGTYESSVNLKITNYVKANLQNRGVTVKMTRTDNSTKSLDERQSLTRKSGSDIFVAIHSNSSTSSSPSGTEAYYYYGFSKPLAQKVHDRLVTAWKSVYSGNSSMLNKVNPSDGGVRFKPFQVIRIEDCPAVLIECGYLSNSTECGKLCTDSVQQKLANAIADGIVDYYKAQ